jgi:hypothetical protein
MGAVLERAAEFVWTHGRLLERRLFEWRFLGGEREKAVEALIAYRNPDGGFGHALEPDLRCPTSQPLFCDFALKALRALGAPDAGVGRSTADFLASVAAPDGLLPAILPDAQRFPRASHWSGAEPIEPGLNMTLGCAASLHALGVRHEWLERATETGFAAIGSERISDAHVLHGVSLFLDSAPDGERAAKLRSRLGEGLAGAQWFIPRAPVERYGLTPLHYAPTPDSSWRPLFPQADLDGHLDDLLARQRDDGGWPIYWEPPGSAAVSEWRACWTLEALTTLDAWGRL